MRTKNHPWKQHRVCLLLTLLVGARAFILPSQQCRNLLLPIQLTTAHRQPAVRPLDQSKRNDEDDPPTVGSSEPTRSRSLLSRFTNPQIDDPGLILSDGLVVQIIAPTLQIAARLALGAPAPTWLQSTDPSLLFNNRPGALLAPTLLHGAALDLVWLVGALAARAYERPAISPIKRRRPAGDGDGTAATKYDWDYSRVYQALFRAGAAATGLWIFATQVDVYMDVGAYVQWGDSIATDARLVVAATEGMADFIFEAITITFWRLYLAYQTERMDSR